MAEDNVEELDRHSPTVESVISRLGRFQDKIESITVVVEWDNGHSDVFHDTKSVGDLAFDAVVLQKYVMSYVEDIYLDE